MKNIKKLIKNSYHERKIRRLKKAGSFKSDDYQTRPARAIFPLRPSVFAYTIGTIILVVMFLVFAPGGKSKPPINAHTRAIDHLKDHTFTYLADPIKTVINEDSGTVVNIYYGLIGDEENVNHYLLISYIKPNDVTFDVKIYNNEPQFGGEGSEDDSVIQTGIVVDGSVSIPNSIINNVINLIKVNLIIDDEIETIFMDLTDHYDNLITGGS